MLLFFKFTVTPVLVGLASLAARRWGNTIAGLLTGFPLMTAPISLFLAIEQGTAFTVSATTGILIALIGISAYSLGYAGVARFAPWPIALTAGYAAFFLVCWVVQPFITSLLPAALTAIAAIVFGIATMPRSAGPKPPSRIPYWEIWLRMAATGAMIALVTALANIVGPAWTGIIATVPVMATVMAIFTHARWGHDAVALFLRSMMLSMPSFASFFVIVGLFLQDFGIVHTYLAATIVAVSLSPVVVRIDRMLLKPGTG